MGDFLDKLQETRTGFLGRMRLLFIFDLVAIFSILYSIFIIINLEYFLNKSSLPSFIPVKIIPFALALIIAVTASILLHRKDKKINVLKLIEKKYPDLNEKLSTAYDNRDETNIIVDSLKTMVSDAINVVFPSQLLPRKKIFSKLILTIFFIAAMVIVSYDPQAYQIPDNTLANVTKAITGDDNNLDQVDISGLTQNIDNIGAKGSGDIFGKPKIASIEGKNIDLALYYGSDIGSSVTDTSQTGNQFIKSAAFPVDILGSNVSDSDYGMLMKKTETEKQLINKYAVERSKI